MFCLAVIVTLLIQTSAINCLRNSLKSNQCCTNVNNVRPFQLRNSAIFAKKSYSSRENKGFGVKKQNAIPEPVKNDATSLATPSKSSESLETPTISESAISVKPTKRLPSGLSASEVFEKYNIQDGTDREVKKPNKIQKSPDDPNYVFGESVMENFPPQVQAKIDQTLVTLTFASLSFVVLTGLAISFGAFKIVYPGTSIPPNLDNLVTNVIAPLFSPAIGIFFFFSITFGLFKFAQISSSQTVYRE